MEPERWQQVSRIWKLSLAATRTNGRCTSMRCARMMQHCVERWRVCSQRPSTLEAYWMPRQ